MFRNTFAEHNSRAWFFYKIMNISGAEAIVATASPVVGQGDSACLVRPYIDSMRCIFTFIEPELTTVKPRYDQIGDPCVHSFSKLIINLTHCWLT